MWRLDSRHPGGPHLNTIIGTRLRSDVQLSPWRPWAFLLLITTAELLTSLVSPQLGLAAHGLLLIGLISCAVATQPEQEANLLLALTFAPLIRLLSLSLPLATLPRLLWYPAVAVALLPALWLAVRTVRVTPRELGFRPSNLVLQILVACTGLGIGVLEYAILRPGPLVASTSWRVYVLAALILVIFTGFTEELLFRGLLLRLAWKSMVPGAAVYVSLLYAAMHIGYGSLENVALMFAIGALFAWFVRRSGSILGVSLAHGIASVTLFLLVPLLLSQPFGMRAFRVLLVVSGVVLVAAVAVFVAAYLTTKVKGENRRTGRVEVQRERRRTDVEPSRPSLARARFRGLIGSVAVAVLLIGAMLAVGTYGVRTFAIRNVSGFSQRAALVGDTGGNPVVQSAPSRLTVGPSITVTAEPLRSPKPAAAQSASVAQISSGAMSPATATATPSAPTDPSATATSAAAAAVMAAGASPSNAAYASTASGRVEVGPYADLATPITAGQDSAGPSVEGQAYIVKRGEWLVKLARRFYGRGELYPRIVDGTNAKAAGDASFPRITDPRKIRTGQKLWIPAK